MKPLMERKVFFLEILLCMAVFPILAAILLCCFPRNALPHHQNVLHEFQ